MQQKSEQHKAHSEKPRLRERTDRAWFTFYESCQEMEWICSFNLEPKRRPGAGACLGWA